MKRTLFPTHAIFYKALILINLILLSTINIFAQAPPTLPPNQKWNTIGNSGTGSDFIGTTNSTSLIFKTNNTKAFEIDPNGDLFVKNLSGMGSGIIKFDNGGKMDPVPFNNSFTQVLSSSGIWKEISTFTGLEVNGNDIIQVASGNFGIGTNTPTAKLTVNGDATINGATTVNGDLKTMGSLTFAGDKTIKYYPASGGRSPAFVIGDGSTPPPAPLPPCFNPTGSTFDQNGLFHSYTIPSSNNMFMGIEGANGVIEVEGTKLLVNYGCGKDVDICTGAFGGNVNLSSGPQGGNVTICSGASGNVVLANGSGTKAGIATANPTAKFEIQNDNPAIPTFWISKVESSTQTRKIIFEPKLQSGDYNYMTQANDAGFFWSDGAGGASRNLDAGFVIAPWPNMPEASGMRITSKGDVGIGIPTPEARMHIINETMTFGVGLRVTSKNFDAQTGILSEMDLLDDKAFVGATRSAAGVFTENFIVYADGYVRARDIKVSLGVLGHMDYVFEKNYSLMPLSELENYLKINNHLPKVPSTAEVEKNNGINLGEMSEIQLMKIEELTLYIIEMNKKLNELSATISSQQKEINELQKK